VGIGADDLLISSGLLRHVGGLQAAGVVTACGVVVAAAVVVAGIAVWCEIWMVTASVMISRFGRSTGDCLARSTRGVQSQFAHQYLSGRYGVICAVLEASVDVVVFHRGVCCPGHYVTISIHQQWLGSSSLFQYCYFVCSSSRSTRHSGISCSSL
jgi:hypothetical protein